ncbi:PREDICTED: lipase member H-like [Papilio polytes]|uniref:lipase member H-like n=1 Tax=Papilio polytes TaxID=76194 RepID=UPI0006767C85|nr:PREDICTED: lipase member H-like [Papilio polytes]
MKVFPVFVVLFCFKNVTTDRLDERFRLLYSDAVKCNFNKTLDLQVNETKVYFYDFTKNVNVVCDINSAVDCITNAIILDISRRLIVFVPGYKCYIKRDIEESIRQAYKTIPDVYLIILDHSAYTYENKEKLKSYERSVLYSFYIGNALGKFLADFNRFGYPSKNFHCIGHSLGAHILGYAGERYFVETSENVWRITGLDPAGPCFANSPKEEQLRSGNAVYVEVYHCNAGHLGTTNAIADADIFFNREGKIQPGCSKGLSDEDLAKCYHKTCVLYWTSSVLNSILYQAVACPSYEAYSAGTCITKTTPIGHSTVVKGRFYVTTESDHVTDKL